jgi:hypothetical protein
VNKGEAGNLLVEAVLAAVLTALILLSDALLSAAWYWLLLFWLLAAGLGCALVYRAWLNLSAETAGAAETAGMDELGDRWVPSRRANGSGSSFVSSDSASASRRQSLSSTSSGSGSKLGDEDVEGVDVDVDVEDVLVTMGPQLLPIEEEHSDTQSSAHTARDSAPESETQPLTMEVECQVSGSRGRYDELLHCCLLSGLSTS